MKMLLRSLHVRAAALAAVTALSLGGSAAAQEAAYLLYLRGSEGPPAVPFRVLWDALDTANARITIDLGEKYEPALTKLALPRVLKYDAKLDKAQFVVRDPELTRFVKVVATSIVQGILQASQLPSAWAQKPDADVTTPRSTSRRRAPGGWRSPRGCTSPTWRRKTPAGRNCRTWTKGDIVFVGGPEPKD